MAGSGRFTVSAVKISTTIIPQIQNSSVSEGLQALLARGSGAPYETFGADGRYTPSITFTTQAIKTALGLCGLLGTSLAASNAVVYFQQYDSNATRTASGCKTFTLADGMLLWRGVSAPDGQIATASFELIPNAADGVTSPFTEAAGVAIPADHADELWMASTPAAAASWAIDTGIAERLFYATGKPWPTDMALETIVPIVSADILTTLPLGKDTSLSSVSLVDVTDAGGRGSSPITFTINKAMSRVEQVGGGAGEVTHGVRIRCQYDKTNAPLVITGLA